MASNEAAVSEYEFKVVEGKLTDINVEMGSENLLQKIDTRYRGNAAVAGVSAVARDMFGQAAAAASLAMYDGEDTQNFMCLINGRVMCGQFGGAQWLKEGSCVKAVVTEQDGVLVARGMLDERQGYVWVGHAWGARAEVIANWKIGLWSFVFAMTCIGIVVAVSPLKGETWFQTMLYFGGIAAGLCAVMALWTGRDMKGLADPSTEIFKLLGFADPAGVNLNSYQISVVASADYLKSIKNKDKEIKRPPELDLSECQYRNTFNYKRAIEEGKLKVVVDGPSQSVVAR